MTKTTQTFIQFSFYTIFIFFPVSHANSQLYEKEHAVLLKLKQLWQSPLSISQRTSLNSSHCSWPEVTCTNGSVTGLSLVDKTITRTVLPFICDLNNLTVIDLSFNYIDGEFPKALYNCSKLQYLDLSQNYLNGTIPDDIFNMSRLQFLSLGANDFSGNIPPSIGRLRELRTLHLYACEFNGSFPPEIGDLSNLEVLELAYNEKVVPARMPSTFTRLKKLTFLWMSESNLIGEIPESIGEMAALEHFDLARNNLSGKIPVTLFTPKNLSIVYLYKNNLSGEIPGVVEAFNLDVVDLSENNLSGKIPETFGKLNKLSGLSLFFNRLSGEIPKSIGRLPGLINLRLFGNNLLGTLPPDFGRYSMLREFQIATNRFIGKLPEYLCYHGKLVGLIAFDNNLSGELPKSLGNCSGLKIVSIYNNEFSGTIPNGLWTTMNMSIMMISDNLFIGELPERLSWNLSRLEMSNNKFSGKIPVGVSSWRNLVVFKASNNLLTGTIPRELTTLPLLTTLLLDQNHLSGSFPSDIISWRSLNILNLRRNELSGKIPGELGSLPGLTDLDLSENQLSGKIPQEVGLLKLTSLNFSSNHLIGMIPIELENNAYANSFLNNPSLCARNPFLNMNINICNSKTKKYSKTSSQFLALIISWVIAVVLCLLASFVLIRVYNKRKRGLDSMWKLTSFQKLNFSKADILLGLTEKNMIGRGGSGKVYRVTVNHSREVVAVKKFWNIRKLEEKLEKQFLAEVEILSLIRHNNLVKLLCCILSDSSKLLVYEYLKNHSLDRWLHRKGKTSSVSSLVHHVVLDWPKRLHIAVGAAKGLTYMHHDCSPPIVHRDVKSSNILLDSKFNAKIADFGLAKILANQGESATMSVVAGSFGNIAPEYAHTTRVNEKIDVYSFGVILLELVTGREASDGDEHTSLAEWAWRHIEDDNKVIEILDEEVMEPCYIDEMCRVFRLGIICTGASPSTRPTMKEVLQILLRCSQPLIFGEKNVESICSSMATELEAVRMGLELVWDEGYKDVICEIDAIYVLQILQRPSIPTDPLACLVEGYRLLIARPWNCSLSHTLREGNACADELIKMGAYSSMGVTVLRDCPPTYPNRWKGIDRVWQCLVVSSFFLLHCTK